MNPAIQRRLIVAATRRGIELPRTVANLLDPLPVAVVADGAWGDFLSEMNRSVGKYRDTITDAMEAEDIEPIVEALSEAMQDLLDALAEKLGYDMGEGDEGDGGEGDEQEYEQPAPAPGPAGGDAWSNATVID